MAYAEAGLTAYDIGDEAIVDMTDVLAERPGHEGGPRQSVSRLQRRGYTATRGPARDPDRRRLRRPERCGRAWRGDGGDERGFSMALGRLGDPLDGACVLVEAHDADGGCAASSASCPGAAPGSPST